jgi:hypothetical protein
MRKLFALLAVVLGLAVVAFAISVIGGRKQRTPDATSQAGEASAVAAEVGSGDRRTPVVVELFTSEGCSSCPPADTLLSRLDRTQPVAGVEVIALAQHVDYWNYLGWSDPFSSHDFSERQGEYAHAFGKDGVYTPQMIVDGVKEFPGSNSRLALDAIAQAAREPKAEVRLSRLPSQTNADPGVSLSVSVEKLPRPDGETADVFLAITEGDLSTDVRRGENAGHTLSHVGVVRRLVNIGSVSASGGGPFASEQAVVPEKGWRRENLRAVVFVQERTGKRVIGAASLKLFG